MIAEVSWVTWASLASSLAAVITALAALVVFGFLRHQQRQTERQIHGATSRFMYEEMSSLMSVFLDKPELRPFIYGGRPIGAAETPEQRQQVLALAGLYCDFFEQLLHQRSYGNLSLEEYNSTWRDFIRALLIASGVLREFAKSNTSFYSPAFEALVTEIEQTFDGINAVSGLLSEIEHAAPPSAQGT